MLALDGLQPDVGHEVLWVLRDCLSGEILLARSEYDPERKTFPSSVYSNLSGTVLSYEWDIQGNTVIHSGLGSKYTGTFSEDGTMLSGGWRPDEGTKSTDGNAYDAVMTRIK